MPSLMASTKLPPFPMLYFHTAEYKIRSKRSVAKGFFLYVPSLFREENFPKNSQHISPYILIVGTGSHVSYCQRGIALSWLAQTNYDFWTKSKKREWLLGKPPSVFVLCSGILCPSSPFISTRAALGHFGTLGFARGKREEALRNRRISFTQILTVHHYHRGTSFHYFTTPGSQDLPPNTPLYSSIEEKARSFPIFPPSLLFCSLLL